MKTRRTAEAASGADASATAGTQSGPLPNFLIIGAMRSGTTAIARYLGEHPDVFMTPGKEIHFFDDHYDRGLGWYRAHFTGARDERAVGEATPRYLYTREAPARMASVVPDARLIAILRNPVDRAYSHYWMNRGNGKEDLSFEEALATETERLRAGGLRYGYVDRGRYAEQLTNLCEHFPRASVYVPLFDDLISKPGEVFAEACRFLGVDDAFVPPNLGDQANQHLEFRWLWLRPITHRMPKGLGRLAGRLNSRKVRYPKMDPATRRGLVERFSESNAALAAWLGRDLSAWGR